jgi:hypothetical protein
VWGHGVLLVWMHIQDHRLSFRTLYAVANIHRSSSIPNPILSTSDQPRSPTYNNQLTLHTESRATYSGAVRREWRTTLGAKSKLLYRAIALSRKPLWIGHMYMYIYTLLFRMTRILTFLSGTSCISTLGESHAEDTGNIYHNSRNSLLRAELWAWVHWS